MGNLKIQRANPKLYNAIQQKIEEAERELAEQESGKTMTTKELAEALGVSVDAITRTVKKVLQPSAVLRRVVNGGNSMVFTEKQATLIKQEIQKHHNLQSRQVDSVTTQIEENQMIANALAILDRRNKELSALLESSKPKLEYYDRYIESDGLTGVRELCKQNHFNSKDFVSFLIEKGYCYRDKSGTIQCYKAYEDKGYFETKDFVKNNFSGKQMFFTAKGKEVLSKKFKSYKVA